MNENIKQIVDEAQAQLTAGMEKLVEEKAAAVPVKFAEIREAFGDSFVADMADLANQEATWDGRTYGGYWPEHARDQRFAGGLEEYVIVNLHWALDISIQDQAGHERDAFTAFRETVYPAILAEAVKQNADLRLFVQSVIAGAETVTLTEAVRRGRDVEGVKKYWARQRATLGL
ncbi:hypothetical protein KKE33_02085 [Patescibacteria group bacterium]|nr:hypothetical protein [Patescibacteria group bacterium]